MESNVVNFPKSPSAQPSGQPAADKMETRERNRERAHTKAEIVRSALQSRLTQDEATQIARNLGHMADEAGLRRFGALAELARRVKDSTFSRQRRRYVRFDDDAEGPAARLGGVVFKTIAETLAVWSVPDDPQLAKDEALLRLAVGVPRLQGIPGPTSPAARDASEAFGRLINLLNIGVNEIAREFELARYFQTLIEDGLELDENRRFSTARTYDGFSLTRIGDQEILMEAGARIPRFLPRVRVATLYRRHVATTMIIRDPELSAQESADAESMYQAGLLRLGLAAAPPSEEAYPSAPAGWENLTYDGIDTVFERLDVWLVIAPEGAVEATKPAFVFMSGESETTDGDVWRTEGVYNKHANNCDLYYNSPMEGEDANNESAINSTFSSATKPLPAVLHSLEHAQQFMLPAFLYCGPDGAISALEVRALVPNLTTLAWHRTEGWGSLLRFLSPEFETFLFQRNFFFNDVDSDYFYASFRPSVLNDTPILIRRFIDPETWSPGPMKSLGGALLRNLLGPRKDSVLAALRQSAETLRTAMDDFNARGRRDFERRYKSKILPVDEADEGEHRDER